MGIVIKDIARIYDIAIHIIIGLGKLALCATKIPYSIPARWFGSTPNYDIGKEGFVHLVFAGHYFADMFISLTNIINRYPKDKMEKIENLLSKRLLTLKKEVVNKEEFQDILSTEKAKYSVKHPPKVAEEMAKISSENHPKLFGMLYAEYVKNNESQKKIQQKAIAYAKGCIRIYSIMYPIFSKDRSEKEAKEQALLYAKTYVNAYSKKFARQSKIQSKKKAEEQADLHAKYFTKLFFSEYQRCLENTPETAEEQALVFAEKNIEIFYKVCTFSPEFSEEETKEIKDILFNDYLHKISQVIKKGINPEFYFIPYVRKYVECLKNGKKKKAKNIATRHAERLTQEITPEIVTKFNKAKMNSVLHKKKDKDSLK
ncbi:hypothetical protein [Candidatus Rhabdochlamydia sp. W815]|uniref:hypothetical protein n=1 Tax=Candidatus Rhabdochlamydia sp. W815 TaxID=2720721 RepID=UPI001BFCD512|nr:hypothetical protein [Candidatus Rhabdochlamydia sp. W815]